jgi:branched-chain amino acid transport system permease protein
LPEVFLQNLLNSIFLGCFYAIIAVGLSLIWGILDIVNLSHGVLMLLAGHIAFSVISLTGLPFLGLSLAVASLVLTMVLVQKLVLSRVLDLPLITFVATLGVAFVLEGAGALIWPKVYINISQSPIPHFTIQGLSFPGAMLETFIASIVVVTSLQLFLKRTFTGMAILLVSQDKQLAESVGISVERIYLIASAIAGVLIGISGYYYLKVFSANIGEWELILMKAFALALLMGPRINLVGLLTGGVALAVLENMATLYVLPLGYRNAITAVFIIAILLVKYKYSVRL